MAELDWNLIKSFVTVAQTGSLSAAARTLSSSQPTIGRHIAELEKALDVTLFRRGRGGYVLTDAGTALYERGKAVSDQAAAFSRLALGAVEAIEGSVRVAASEVVAACVLPAMLARLAEEEPGIQVEVVASNRVENLLSRDADIAIRMVEPMQNELVARKVTDIPLVACAARAYLDRRGRPTRLEQLRDHDLVGFDRGEELIHGLAELGLPLARDAFRLRSDNQIFCWEAVRAGNGISVAQLPLVRGDPTMEIILPDLKLPSLPVWLAMHADVRTSLRIRRLADFLYTELRRYSAG
ncbi:LysR family transcriptional regulator [Mesorhizobium sp. BAC0120]|uniref:LysR family transcriptional regulator n=1 Tax=Mesorhizobium sp. BAC0120 TaxID=3090670 RepID=UPI00298C1D4F|nr:LysR family transcriptional regulator [Mesorhizobium sp. BAC0120]MDW6021759.1 LysR family transcriptional regulator [Mesorhizobium sp. BAC0120]